MSCNHEPCSALLPVHNALPGVNGFTRCIRDSRSSSRNGLISQEYLPTALNNHMKIARSH